MPLSYSRLTILEIINQVRRKLGLGQVTSLTQDSLAINMVDYLNDTIAQISDYGDWQEMIVETTITASSSVIDYLVTDSTAAVKNIHEIAFKGRIAPMNLVTLDDIRRLQRTNTTGIPTQWATVGVDNVSTGNPYFRVFPTPGTNQNNQTFSICFYKRPKLYTTSDASVIPEFDGQLIVMGVLAKVLLDESRGTPEMGYQFTEKDFEGMIEEVYNRFNGDSGSDTTFRPSYSRAKR